MTESECENTDLCTLEHSVENTYLCTPEASEQFTDMPLSNQDLLPLNNNDKVVEVPNNQASDKIHKSLRHKSKHVYLQDYHCESRETAHWFNLIQFNALSSLHKQIVKNHDEYTEPRSYLEASKNSKWVEAMDKELKALSQNHTWDVVSLPPGKKPIGNKWVYKVKLKSDGTLERFKARSVAKGYNQRQVIDYEETFSPVVKMTTVRCLLAVATSQQWLVHQLDVNNAFLHGDLNEEVYMTMPQGVPNPQNKVCLLRKSLYGLKQASRKWHEKLMVELKRLGFTQSRNDYSLFVKRQNSLITIMVVYVDDTLLT